jgi:hypothetical protein
MVAIFPDHVWRSDGHESPFPGLLVPMQVESIQNAANLHTYVPSRTQSSGVFQPVFEFHRHHTFLAAFTCQQSLVEDKR